MASYISPFAELFDDTPRDTKDQELPALRIVVHITGRATYNNAEKHKEPPLKRLGEYFDKRGRPYAHYSVDPWGRIACHARETETPYSQGWAAYGGASGILAKIKDGELVVPDWWLATWGPGASALLGPFSDPVQLLRDVGAGSRELTSPNQRAVTIEFIQYGNQYKLTVAQYVWGSVLIDDIARRHGIPKSPARILGHEDFDPWGRGSKSGGWDPGARRTYSDVRFSYEAMMHPPLGIASGVAIMTPLMPDWAVWDGKR